jgi:hypothetical protein
MLRSCCWCCCCCCCLYLAGLQPGQFVYMLNNGPETDTAIYNGANNGVGLTIHTSQVGPGLTGLLGCLGCVYHLLIRGTEFE